MTRWITLLLVLVALLLAAACAGGGGGTAGDGGGTEQDSGEAVEAQIRAAVEQAYDFISDERWEDVWNTYASDFTERCSFDAMVELLAEVRAQGVVRFEVSAFDEIEFIGDAAQATYSVVGFDQGGQQTASYDYDTSLVKEDGEWRFKQSCY